MFRGLSSGWGNFLLLSYFEVIALGWDSGRGARRFDWAFFAGLCLREGCDARALLIELSQ